MNDQTATDRRAQALAEVNKMETDLGAAYERISVLNKDNERLEDRCDLLTEERARYRREATMYRTKLVELATSMANIGLLTIQAQEIMQTVKELAEGETEEQAAEERRSAAEAVANLPLNEASAA